MEFIHENNLEAAHSTASKQNMQEWPLTAPSMLVV